MKKGYSSIFTPTIVGAYPNYRGRLPQLSWVTYLNYRGFLPQLSWVLTPTIVGAYYMLKTPYILYSILEKAQEIVCIGKKRTI